jgi:hypothetical protein
MILTEMQGGTWICWSVVTYLCAEACRIGKREYNYASHLRSNAFILRYEKTMGSSAWISVYCFIWYGLSGEEFRYFTCPQEVYVQKSELCEHYVL